MSEMKPVAYCALAADGTIPFFDGKPILSTVRNEHHPIPLVPAPTPERLREIAELVSLNWYAASYLQQKLADHIESALREAFSLEK